MAFHKAQRKILDAQRKAAKRHAKHLAGGPISKAELQSFASAAIDAGQHIKRMAPQSTEAPQRRPTDWQARRQAHKRRT